MCTIHHIVGLFAAIELEVHLSFCPLLKLFRKFYIFSNISVEYIHIIRNLKRFM